jgi:cytoskeletal protein CcmA (bactofilin family)
MSNGHPRQEQVTVIAAGAELEGSIRCSGVLQLEGAVLGTVTCSELWVAPKAGILGEVSAERVSLSGTVLGIVLASDALRVASSGKLCGHARYARLEVERGGRVEGTASVASEPDANAPLCDSE